MTQSELVSQAKQVVLAIAEVIKEAGEIPSGHLYATLNGNRMSLDTYNMIIGILVASGKVTNKGHLLKWVGPK